ncbi:MAG TPA: G1 family glutamic endopeptidase [Candidatus Dormibacteraeota bacterium]
MGLGKRGLWLALVAGAFGAAALCAALPAAASGSTAVFHARPIAVVAANKSQNWFGYNQGELEKGSTFHAITATWIVPTASQRVAGQSEYSATWAGIGGGCVDAGCVVVDNSLIQAGTEQDVAANGARSYSAWWEVLPGPSMSVTSLLVRPGDHMYLSISESSHEVWQISLQNQTRHQAFRESVPYSSSYATAEWVDEAPVVVGTNSGLAPLPNLTVTHFDQETVNGVNPGLQASEEMDLVDGNGSVIGTPSAPDPEKDGFNDCAWASTCSAPAASTSSTSLVRIQTRWLTVGGPAQAG